MVPFTQGWHSQPYPFISPTRAELSAKGKNVVITGGGTGIGNAIGVAFAQSGAKSIAIIGRRANKLANGVSAISKAVAGSAKDDTTTVFYETADLANREQTIKAFNNIATKVGKIDVLVSNAGTMSEPGPIATCSAETLRQAFELNVVTALHTFQGFLPHASSKGAVVINVTTALVHIAPWPGAGVYPTAKAGALKLWDQIAAENTQLRITSVHPGWVPTDMNSYQKEATDSGESLCALNFSVLVSYSIQSLHL